MFLAARAICIIDVEIIMAKKVALLIGVSEYGQGLTPLHGAVKDVEAMQQVLGLRKEDVEPIEERILGNTSEREAGDRLSPIEQTLTSQPQTVLPVLNASIDISARPPGAQRGTQANDLRSASTLRKPLLLVFGVGITIAVAQPQ